jgi:uncharacterized protein YndB with AHSA1/START domain
MPSTTRRSETAHSTLLPTAMSINALFSAATGVVLLAGGWTLDGPLGVPTWILAGVGAALVAFSGTLLWLLATPRHLRKGARLVVAADLAWVAAAGVILILTPSVLSPVGRWVLADLSAVVAAIAVAQAVGLRRLGPDPVTGAAPVSLLVQRTIDAPADQVWAAVADAGGYHRFATGITDTTVDGPTGEGMIRVCTDDRGGQWAERCTLWEEGLRYRMTVDTSSYPAHYRMLLQEFAQTWTIQPTPDGTRVTLAFDGSVKLGIIGRLAIRILGNPRRLGGILEAYDRELTAAATAAPRRTSSTP